MCLSLNTGEFVCVAFGLFALVAFTYCVQYAVRHGEAWGVEGRRGELAAKEGAWLQGRGGEVGVGLFALFDTAYALGAAVALAPMPLDRDFSFGQRGVGNGEGALPFSLVEGPGPLPASSLRALFPAFCSLPARPLAAFRRPFVLCAM